MKTTNILIDYIIVGFIVVGSFFLFQYITDISYIKIDLNNISGIEASILLFVLFTIGILCNQIFDTIIKNVKIVFGLDAGEKDEHLMLQVIITKSKKAYEYLSYRRTIIRVIRIFFPIGFIIYILFSIKIIVLNAQGYFLYISLEKKVIMCLILIIASYSFVQNENLEKGYHKAIENFFENLKK